MSDQRSDPGGEDVFRAAEQWPPVKAGVTTLYLDAATAASPGSPPHNDVTGAHA